MAQREEAIPAGGGSPKNVLAVRSVLRQAWKIDDAAKAEKLLRNLARRLEPDWEGVASLILEGLDEMLTVTRLDLQFADMQEYHRECHRHGASGMLERQTLAFSFNGDALGRRRHAGGEEGLSQVEGLQAIASATRSARQDQVKNRHGGTPCSNRRGRLTFKQRRPLQDFQQRLGHHPKSEDTRGAWSTFLTSWSLRVSP